MPEFPAPQPFDGKIIDRVPGFDQPAPVVPEAGQPLIDSVPWETAAPQEEAVSAEKQQVIDSIPGYTPEEPAVVEPPHKIIDSMPMSDDLRDSIAQDQRDRVLESARRVAVQQRYNKDQQARNPHIRYHDPYKRLDQLVAKTDQ